MPIYEVDLGGKTYEVDAPDPKTAWSYASYSASQQPAVAPEKPAAIAQNGLESLAPQRSAFDPTKPLNAEDYLAAVARRKEESPDRSASDVAVDAGITFLKGAIGLPESFVGLVDIPTKGAIGKMLEDAGYNPREAKEILDTYLSEAQQAANRKVAETKGFLPTIGAALQNPSTIATGIGESLPQMLGGAGIARGILKAAPKAGAVIAGGLGEGILGAGSAAEQIRGENEDKLLTNKQALAALGSGAGTAAFGIAGGRLAQKLGLDDIDTILASGASRGGAKSVLDFAKRATGSGISEGAFEEMPQSAQEKMWMNYATDKPLLEGVPEAMGVGLTTGFAMGVGGAGAGSVLKRKPEDKQREKYERPEPDMGLEALARSKGFLAPTKAAEPTAQPAAKPTTPADITAALPATPESETQDLEAMMREVLGEEPIPNKLSPTVAETQQPVAEALAAPVVETVAAEPEAEQFDSTGWEKQPVKINAKTGEPSLSPGRDRFKKVDDDGTTHSVLTKDGVVVQSNTRSPIVTLTNSILTDENESVSGRIEVDNRTGNLVFIGEGDQGGVLKMSPRAKQRYQEGVPFNKIAEEEFSDAGGIRPDGTRTPHTTTSVMEKPASVETTKPKKDFYSNVDATLEALDSTDKFVEELARMRDRQSPLTVNPAVDRIASRDGMMWRLANTDPAKAAAFAQGIQDNVDKYSESSGFPPDVLKSFALRINKELGIQTKPTQAPAPTAEAQTYDTPDLRIKQTDALGDTLEQLVYGEMESYGRAALKKRSLTNGYANKKDNWTKAMEAGDKAFATNDYSVFEPYAQLFPKTAKKLQAHLAAPAKAAPAAAATNLQVAEKDIKGQHDATYDAAAFSDPEDGWFDTATNKLHMQYIDGVPVKHYAGTKTPTGVTNLTPITNAEEARAAVDAGKHFVTVGPDSTAVKEAAPVEAPVAKGKKAAKPKTNLDKVAHLRKQSWDKNPLMAYVADKGLYHEKGKPGSLMSEFNGGKTKMVSGYGPVFKASGLRIDALLPIAIQDGFVPQDATEEDLYSLIQQAFSGKRIEALYKEQGQEDLAAKYTERMDMEEPTSEERTGQSDAEWHGMSEADYAEMMAREITDTTDDQFDELVEAAKEFSETPASNVSMRAAMEALGFTEEEIQNEERRTAAKAPEAVAGDETKGNEPSEAAPSLELETQTAEELKSKQDEIDRLTKENERLAKQAEAKAKADAERDEFVLTGSDRPADVAAAQGQKDIFGAMEEETPVAASSVTKLQKIAESLLDSPRTKETLDEVEYEGETYESRQRTYDGRLFGSELELVRDAVGTGKSLTLVNEPTRVLSLQLTGKQVGQGRDVLIMETVYTPKTEKPASNAVVTFVHKTDSEPGKGQRSGYYPGTYSYEEGVKIPELFQRTAKNAFVGSLKESEIYTLQDSDKLKREASKAGFEYRQGSGDSEVRYLQSQGYKAMRRDAEIIVFDAKDANFKKAKPEVASEVVGPAEKPAAPQLTREPVTIEGEFTEVGEEKQRALITTQVNKLSEAQTSTLEKFYGFARDTEEFANAVRQDVVNFITKGATYVNGKIRAIIRSMANGVLSVAVAFNPQFVSMPYTIAVPQYETRIEQVMQEVPASVQKQMSDDAKRAYATIYPAIKAELQANDKFFIVADKQTANTFVFNPDGSPFMNSKTLFGIGIGDFMKGDNNIVANRITPAGLFNLGLRDAKRSAGEAVTAGEYDFGKVFVLDKSYMGANGPYSNTIMHSVWTKETDAKQRLAALQKPGAEDSRYSFGCINVDKETYGKLVTNNLAQMDGAKIFIVPENGTDVMSFVNGEATYSTDIIRQRAEPVTKETKQEVQRAAETAEAERTQVGKEEEMTLQNLDFKMASEINKNRKDARKKLFTMLASATRRRSTIMKRAAEGKFTLGMQRDLIELDETRQGLKEVIADTREPDLSPIAFLNRAGKALAENDISKDVYDVITQMYNKTPELLNGLRLSIVQPKEGSPAAGDFNPYKRVVRLYTGTSGSYDPVTIRHEVVHSLEQMMSPDLRSRIVDAWYKDFQAAMRKYEQSQPHKDYFKAVLNYLANPTPLTQRLAIEALPSYDMYQYMNPSEYWAVNAEPLMERQLGGRWDKFVKFVKGLFEAMKNVFGFDNKSAVHKTFKEIMSGPFERLDKSSLSKFVSNSAMALENIHTNYKGQPMPDPTWAMPETGLWEGFIQTFQDNYRDLRRAQQIITKKYGAIDSRLNAYGKEVVSAGRTSDQLGDFSKYEIRPLLAEMIKHNVTNDELSTYLQNRYAPERNEIINEKNQSPSVRDQGSGIHTNDAKEYMRKLDADRKQVLESLAKRVDKIVRETQDVLVESGQETKDTINQWRHDSPHYVPLQRDETELDFVIDRGGIGGSRGIGTRGTFGRQALGSTKTVVNILENVMLQRERAVQRAENARIGQALYAQAIANPNPKFWMAINPDAIKDKEKMLQEIEGFGLDPAFAANLMAEPRTGRLTEVSVPSDLFSDESTTVRTVTYQVDRMYRQAKNVFPVRINGKDRFVLFNPKSIEAIRLVDALKDNDPEKIGLIVGAASSFTRWFTSVNSQYNLAFGLINFWNDTQGAWLKLSATPLAGKQKLFTKNVIPALMTLGVELRRQRGQTEKQASKALSAFGKEVVSKEDIDYYRRMRAAGGMTGFRDTMLKTKMNLDLGNAKWSEKITFEEEHAMERELKALQRGPTMQKAIFFADMISDLNDMLENASRLAAFKVAVMPKSEGGLGLSDEEGAIIAKELTINFNKHGARTKNLRGLYGFLNASIQSTANLAITLAGPAGRTIVKGGLLIGTAQALLLLAAGYDDDEPPDFVKNKGFIIPTGDNKYLVWNLPGGFRAIPNMARLITEGMLISTGALKSNKGLGGKALEAAGVLVDAVNPWGSAGSILQLAAPTAADPIVALTENKDAFGRPIYKEDSNLKPKPGWQRTRDSARTISKGLSYMLNFITSGGEQFEKGFISPTGDEIDFTINQIIGGGGKEIEKAASALSNLATGEPTPAYKRPLLNRVAGEIETPEATSARFYDNVAMLAQHKNVIDGRAASNGDVDGYIKKHPLAQFAGAGESFENDISDMNSTLHKLRNMPQTPELKATIKEIEAAKTEAMKALNDLVRSAQ